MCCIFALSLMTWDGDRQAPIGQEGKTATGSLGQAREVKSSLSVVVMTALSPLQGLCWGCGGVLLDRCDRSCLLPRARAVRAGILLLFLLPVFYIIDKKKNKKKNTHTQRNQTSDSQLSPPSFVGGTDGIPLACQQTRKSVTSSFPAVKRG